MPTLAQVKAIYRDELLSRAPGQMAQIGENWPDQFQGFFFPGNEDVVDQCALKVFRLALAIDGLLPTDSSRKQVRKVINTDTVTDLAISIIFLACFTPPEQLT